MPVSKEELQIVVVDTESDTHDDVISKLMGSGLTQTRLFANPDEAKICLMQFEGPSLVVFFLPHTAESLVNYTRFFRRGVTKQVEIVFVAEPKTSRHIEKAYRDLGALEFLRDPSPETIVSAVEAAVASPTAFLADSVEAQMSTQDVFAKTPIRVSADSGEFQNIPVYSPDGTPPGDEADIGIAKSDPVVGERRPSSFTFMERDPQAGDSPAAPAPPKLKEWSSFSITDSPQQPGGAGSAHKLGVGSSHWTGEAEDLGESSSEAFRAPKLSSSSYSLASETSGGSAMKLYAIIGVCLLVIGVLLGIVLGGGGSEGSSDVAVAPAATPQPPRETPLPAPVAYQPSATPIPRAPAFSATTAPTPRPTPFLLATATPTPAPLFSRTPPPAAEDGNPRDFAASSNIFDLPPLESAAVPGSGNTLLGGGSLPSAFNAPVSANLKSLREDWASGRVAPKQRVTTEGFVTLGGGGFEPERNQFVLQASGGAILVEDPDNLAGGSPLIGAYVKVTGTIEESEAGMLALRATAEAEYLPIANHRVQEANAVRVAIGQIAEPLESSLIEVAGLSINTNAGLVDRRSFEYRDRQGAAIIVRISEHTNIALPLPGAASSISGILIQQGVVAARPVFVLMPRMQSDIKN